jgi:hypothetical protein
MNTAQLLQQLYFYFSQNRLISFFFFFIIIVVFLVVPYFTFRGFVLWIKGAIEGEDRKLQWIELAAVVFMVCYVLGHFVDVSDFVMATSAFGALGLHYLKFLMVWKNIGIKKEDEESSL